MPESGIAHVNVDFVGIVDEIGRQIVEAVSSYAEPVSPSNKASQYETENAIAINGSGMEAGVMELGSVVEIYVPGLPRRVGTNRRWADHPISLPHRSRFLDEIAPCRGQ
jgi:hypothetical protein